MIAIIDYGVGNLFSLQSSLKYIGQEARVTADRSEIEAADRIILPGVGAKPLMGICLGMQLLFEKSYEYGEHEGLGLIKGSIVPIKDVVPEGYKIPHIGWNALKFKGEKDPLFKYTKEGDHVYFVHSFYGADCDESTIAVTEYSATLTAAVRNGSVYGCQFHPEKSGNVGLDILRAFCEI